MIPNINLSNPNGNSIYKSLDIWNIQKPIANMPGKTHNHESSDSNSNKNSINKYKDKI